MALFFFTNNPNQARLVTRFNKTARVIKKPGWYFKLPFVEKVLEPILTSESAVTETLVSKTKDDIYPELPISIHYTISDPDKYHWKGAEKNVLYLIKKQAEKEVQRFAATQTLDELFHSRNELDAFLNKKEERGGVQKSFVEHIADTFGVQLKTVFIEDIVVPEEVRQASNAKRAAQLNYEAEIIKAKAEGEAAALRRDAALKGLAHTYNDLVREGMKEEQAKEFIFGTVEAETMRKIGESGNMVVAMGKGKRKELIETATLKKLSDVDKKDKKPPESPKPE